MLPNIQYYSICDSWNTYHVIKTVQVDPFVPICILSYLTMTTVYSLKERDEAEGRGDERDRGRQREMVEDD